eukprot:20062_5
MAQTHEILGGRHVNPFTDACRQYSISVDVTTHARQILTLSVYKTIRTLLVAYYYSATSPNRSFPTHTPLSHLRSHTPIYPSIYLHIHTHLV